MVLVSLDAEIGFVSMKTRVSEGEFGCCMGANRLMIIITRMRTGKYVQHIYTYTYIAYMLLMLHNHVYALVQSLHFSF